MTQSRSFLPKFLTAVAIAGTFILATRVMAGDAKGTLTLPKGTVTVKFAYLVKGPDAFDTKKIIRKIILSPSDLSAKIQDCKVMGCVDGEVTEGMSVDLDGGPRLNYWVVLNGGLVQHSGTEEIAALKTTADDEKHLAGKLSFDDATSGGPKVDVDFDATFVKEFTQAR